MNFANGLVMNDENMFSVDRVSFQKMLFLYNAVNDGWTVKKNNDSYIFKKNHEGKKEVFLDTYLTNFMRNNLDISKLLVE